MGAAGSIGSGVGLWYMRLGSPNGDGVGHADVRAEEHDELLDGQDTLVAGKDLDASEDQLR